jgi:hypothetical protein
MAITVTVGRNVGDSLNARPMDTAAWASFREEVRIAVQHYVGEPYFVGTGEGYSETWGREDAFTVVAAEPGYSDKRGDLHAELARVRKYYGQAAVAVTEGRTEFV